MIAGLDVFGDYGDFPLARKCDFRYHHPELYLIVLEMKFERVR